MSRLLDTQRPLCHWQAHPCHLGLSVSPMRGFGYVMSETSHVGPDHWLQVSSSAHGEEATLIRRGFGLANRLLAGGAQPQIQGPVVIHTSAHSGGNPGPPSLCHGVMFCRSSQLRR